MNKKGKTLLIGLVIGLAIGCATTAVVKPIIIPKAHANVTQHWEHFCVDSSDKNYSFSWTNNNNASWARETLKKIEGQGWELVGLMNNQAGTYGFCFKRPAKK